MKQFKLERRGSGVTHLFSCPEMELYVEIRIHIPKKMWMTDIEYKKDRVKIHTSKSLDEIERATEATVNSLDPVNTPMFLLSDEIREVLINAARETLKFIPIDDKGNIGDQFIEGLDDFGVMDLISASLYYFGPMNPEQIIKKIAARGVLVEKSQMDRILNDSNSKGLSQFRIQRSDMEGLWKAY